MRILIITEVGDGNAYAVAEALRRKRVNAVLGHTSDFPGNSTETVLFERGERSISINGPEAGIKDADFDVVWRRRPSINVDMKRLHPADRRFAELECQIFQRSLLATLCPHAQWINPQEAAISASSKLVQHHAAIGVGFAMPDTIYTNDPAEIKNFIRRNGGCIVYKTFRPVSWRDDETAWAAYTSVLEEDQLVAAEKAYELRVTVMGNRAFAAKILSQDTSRGRIDWRKAYSELRMEPYPLPRHIEEQCFSLLKGLGLVFGCFDFIVTPAGEYLFLEVNEMGQFLFVEDYAGLPLLDAFTEFLIQGVDFNWDPTKVSIRHGDLQEMVAERLEASRRTHPPLPDNTVFEGRAKRRRPGLPAADNGLRSENSGGGVAE
jgi:hypothetical protein